MSSERNVPQGILLARHGQTQWNVERRMLGQGDPPLTEVGLAQARALAEALRGVPIDFVLASDLIRARRTAEIVAGVLGLGLELRPGWREQHRGEWTGLTRDEARAGWPEEFERYRRGDPDSRPPGGESRREFEARVIEARRAAEREFAARRILVVTHRGAIRILVPDHKPGHAEWIALASDRPPAGDDR